jgi:copper chaperone CopZ
MRRFLFFLVILNLCCYSAKAQFLKAEVGIDGFTCSMCALGVENSIRQLAFVEDVKMDLNKGTALIFFRENKKISIRRISDKIYDSGFSVRYMQADYSFPDTTMNDYGIYKTGEEELHFLGIGKTSIKGPVTIIFLNKRLISKKEYTRWEGWIKEDTRKNGKGENTYYVTLLRD